MDFDRAYENGSYIPNADEYPAKWQSDAEKFRRHEFDAGRAQLNVPYGTGPRQLFDLFFPSSRPKGLVVFVHGGYWRAFDNKLWSHMSAGLTAHGWVVAMPSYTLAPEVRISEITKEIAEAISVAAKKVAGPIVLVGHSAGGQLVARMLCQDVALAVDVVNRIERCVSISPVGDLRPLLMTKMNDDFQMSEAEAVKESPTLHKDIRNVRTTVWVGSEERPAFLDQAEWLVDAWPNAKLHVAPGRHHFDVIEDLENPDSVLVNTIIGGS